MAPAGALQDLSRGSVFSFSAEILQHGHARPCFHQHAGKRVMLPCASGLPANRSGGGGQLGRKTARIDLHRHNHSQVTRTNIASSPLHPITAAPFPFRRNVCHKLSRRMTPAFFSHHPVVPFPLTIRPPHDGPGLAARSVRLAPCAVRLVAWGWAAHLLTTPFRSVRPVCPKTSPTAGFRCADAAPSPSHPCLAACRFRATWYQCQCFARCSCCPRLRRGAE